MAIGAFRDGELEGVAIEVVGNETADLRVVRADPKLFDRGFDLELRLAVLERVSANGAEVLPEFCIMLDILMII